MSCRRFVCGRAVAWITIVSTCRVIQLERNVQALPQSLQQMRSNVHIRPHAKAHKCASIARLQMRESQVLSLSEQVGSTFSLVEYADCRPMLPENMRSGSDGERGHTGCAA